MIRPDYNNSILNLITSILKYYNVESKYNSLPEIDEILKKDYNNVVLLILDGMGENILNELKEEFLNSGLLGEGIPHKKIDDFVGDYVAISTSGTRILLENYLTVATGKVDNKVSTHCGLTKEELEVPIIKIEI